ncbi:MAG: ORF6N domain-containing protein [Clostridia bacterium]|nr:ORF6N domain-containing protein [Clostridia bacterium]
MADTITINNQDLTVRQYKGQMVVTFNDIDLVHNRPTGTARRNFNTNKAHFIEGEDFFKIQPNEIRTVGIKSPNGGIVVTESGYLMLVKSFTDDLSWEVQRQLVKTYFRYKEQLTDNSTLHSSHSTLKDKPYEYFDKTYNGVPVLTTADVEHLTGINSSTACWYLRRHGEKEKDYYLLCGRSLASYKNENPKADKLASKVVAVTKSGFIKLCRAYGVKVEKPKCFEVKAEKPQKTAENDLQKRIKFLKDRLTAIDVLLDQISRQVIKDDVPMLCNTANYLGMELSVYLSNLIYCK